MSHSLTLLDGKAIFPLLFKMQSYPTAITGKGRHGGATFLDLIFGEEGQILQTAESVCTEVQVIALNPIQFSQDLRKKTF